LELSALYQSHTQLDQQIPQPAAQMVNLLPGPAIWYPACLAQQAMGLGLSVPLLDMYVCHSFDQPGVKV
jgi:hypothetical protein